MILADLADHDHCFGVTVLGARHRSPFARPQVFRAVVAGEPVAVG